jgi:hypothetical protein
MRALDEITDLIVILTDNQGNEIIRNDDNVGEDTNFFDGLIREVMLPYDGFYSIVAIVVDGPGDYEIELSLIQAGIPGASLPLYAVLNPDYSMSFLEDESELTPYFVGDMGDETGDLQTLLYMTFHLPPLENADLVDSAILDLSPCFDASASSDGFEGLGNLSLYLDAMFASAEEIEIAPSEEALFITFVDDCAGYDVLDIVREAYENDTPILQFHLEYDNVVDNQDLDGAIFPEPRLFITMP